MPVPGWISGVKFRSTTVGTGTIFSAGAVSAAWRTPTAAENGLKLSYEILNINAPTQRENGRGFWNQSAQSLSRPGGADLIFPASLVNFSAGAELHVSIVPLGEDFVEGHWKDGGGLIPGAIDMSTRAKYDRLTIASPITWGMSSSTPAAFGAVQAWLNVVGATRAQTWPARFMSAEPLVPLPASLPVGTYLLLMEWSPDADPTDVGGVGDPHRILTKVHGFNAAAGDEATFNPSLVDLSRIGTYQYNALTQTGALAFALNPAKTPIIGSMVLVPILGSGGATTWSSDFVGAGGLPSFLENGDTHWIAISWEKDAVQTSPGVFADKALVVVPGQTEGAQIPGEDNLNVTSYGAVGNGVTNDVPAISSGIDAAIAANKALFFPTGTYRFSSAIAKTLASGRILKLIFAPDAEFLYDAAVATPLSITAPTVAIPTIGGDFVRDSSSLTVLSTSGIAAGDLLSIHAPMVMDAVFGSPLVATHVIASVDSGTGLTLASPLRFNSLRFMDQIWTGNASTDIFWFPSYFVPSSSIEVLLGGVVQGSGFAFVAHGGDSNHQGWDIDFVTPPGSGVEVRIKLKDANPPLLWVSRGGKLIVEGMKARGASRPNGSMIYVEGLSEPEFFDLEFEDTTIGQTGDGLHLSGTVKAKVDRAKLIGLRYGIYPVTSEDCLAEHLVGRNQWHVFSAAQWDARSVVRNVRGDYCADLAETHAAWDTTFVDIKGRITGSGMIRGHGGTIINCDLHSTGTSVTVHGATWTNNGATNSPLNQHQYIGELKITASSFQMPAVLDGYQFRCQQLARLTIESSYMDGWPNSGGTLAQIGVREVRVDNSTMAGLELRQVLGRAYVSNSNIGTIWLAGGGGNCPVLSVVGCKIGAPVHGGYYGVFREDFGAVPAIATVYRMISGCELIGTGITALTELGPQTARYHITDCILSGVTIPAEMITYSALFWHNRYINGTPLQIESAGTETLIVSVSDETTALTTGVAKVTFRMPYALTLTDVRASVSVFPTGSSLVVDINVTGTGTILSPKLSIDANEKTSTTAAIPRGITIPTLANDAEITIDIDAVGSSVAGAGLKVYMIGTH